MDDRQGTGATKTPAALLTSKATSLFSVTRYIRNLGGGRQQDAQAQQPLASWCASQSNYSESASKLPISSRHSHTRVAAASEQAHHAWLQTSEQKVHVLPAFSSPLTCQSEPRPARTAGGVAQRTCAPFAPTPCLTAPSAGWLHSRS